MHKGYGAHYVSLGPSRGLWSIEDHSSLDQTTPMMPPSSTLSMSRTQSRGGGVRRCVGYARWSGRNYKRSYLSPRYQDPLLHSSKNGTMAFLSVLTHLATQLRIVWMIVYQDCHFSRPPWHTTQGCATLDIQGVCHSIQGHLQQYGRCTRLIITSLDLPVHTAWARSFSEDQKVRL